MTTHRQNKKDVPYFLTGFSVTCTFLYYLKTTKVMDCQNENFMRKKKQ